MAEFSQSTRDRSKQITRMLRWQNWDLACAYVNRLTTASIKAHKKSAAALGASIFNTYAPTPISPL